MAMLATVQGERPPRPTHPTFTENLWKLIQRCWDQDPHLRPEASEILQVLTTPSVLRLFWRSPIHWLDCALAYSDLPSWKRLISPALSMDERVSLITSVFSDRDEIEVFRNLSGDDARAFVDVVDEASIHVLLHLKND